MGKKSKRTRGGGGGAGGGGGGGAGAPPPEATAAAARTPTLPADDDAASSPPPSKKGSAAARRREEDEEETSDNLRFEDPYEDAFEEEECDVVEDDEGGAKGATADENGSDRLDPEAASARAKYDSALAAAESGGGDVVLSWNPLTCPAPEGGAEELEMDESAYAMHHAIRPEWPSLSFDFLRDGLGDGRTRFPHSCVAAVGSQAEGGGPNRLTILRMSDLGRTHRKADVEEEEEDWESVGSDDDEDDGDESSDGEEDEDLDLDPVLEHYNLRHAGCVNRVRCMPQNPAVVATWSDSGKVNLYDVRGVLDIFDAGSGRGTRSSDSQKGGNRVGYRRDPFFVYSGHTAEGFALDWSPVHAGRLATGDCDGNVHVWDPSSGAPLPSPSYIPAKGWSNSSFAVQHVYGPSRGSSDGCSNLDNPSVEDIQWSPTEATVLAAAECGGYVKVYDVRCPDRAQIARRIHGNGSDVNVIAWNRRVANLLASGGDDGTFCVWDLRAFRGEGGGAEGPKPLARFSCHKMPITSLEWHPTDESMVAVSDDVGTYVYDLSVEEDEDAGGKEGRGSGGGGDDDGDGGIPPQLLFVHSGSRHTKEVHWHPQIPSLLMTTSQSGYNIFIPSNL